ncbi:MAG: hypothetical protein PHQ12_11855 [Chthoniobacteraceae bacterium]|nr:hypothetical protein [Chthoniobacteraceae bacterium]
MKTPLFKQLAALALCACAVLPARADLLSPNMDSKDAIGFVNSLETKDGISAQFWMTTDEEIFSTYSRSGAIRGLKPTVKVKRNTPIYLALFMANPGVRSVTLAREQTVLSSDVTFDLYIINPAGVLSLANKQRAGWKGTPPTPGLVTLAKDRGVLNFEAIDPLGEYAVVVILHDNVRKSDMKLMRKLELVE